MEFDVSNYLYIWESFKSPSIGLYFDDPVFGRSNRWLLNPWEARLEGLNVPEPLKRELLRWRYSLKQPRPDGPDTDRWLDAMTYRDYLVREQHLPQAIADFAEPMLASGVGFGSSVVSAYTAIKKVGMPGGSGADDVFGVKGLRPNQDLGHILDHKPVPNCFPGGNAEVARAFLKYLIPDAVEGSAAFNDLVTSPISFDNLDKAGQPVRVRLSAQVVDVRHETSPKTGVRVVYAKAGKLFATNARAVVMASGGWITKHVVSDLPKEHLRAFDEFHNAPVVVANVAIRNWRFLEKLGMSSGVYTGGEFGFSCNIRRPMKLANYAPPLDPSKPIVLTFYAPMLKPGLSAAAQGAQCRAELLATSYLEFEGRIRRQMLRLFGAAGLDPVRDIAGITINRWGHALVVPTPGFTFGRNGAPAPPDVIRQEHGRIAFASAELRGLQNFRGAVYESKRAVQQLARYFGGV
jgi:spermidine dehydrogenase